MIENACPGSCPSSKAHVVAGRVEGSAKAHDSRPVCSPACTLQTPLPAPRRTPAAAEPCPAPSRSPRRRAVAAVVAARRLAGPLSSPPSSSPVAILRVSCCRRSSVCSRLSACFAARSAAAGACVRSTLVALRPQARFTRGSWESLPASRRGGAPSPPCKEASCCRRSSACPRLSACFAARSAAAGARVRSTPALRLPERGITLGSGRAFLPRSRAGRWRACHEAGCTPTPPPALPRHPRLRGRSTWMEAPDDGQLPLGSHVGRRGTTHRFRSCYIIYIRSNSTALQVESTSANGRVDHSVVASRRVSRGDSTPHGVHSAGRVGARGVDSARRGAAVDSARRGDRGGGRLAAGRVDRRHYLCRRHFLCRPFLRTVPIS